MQLQPGNLSCVPRANSHFALPASHITRGAGCILSSLCVKCFFALPYFCVSPFFSSLLLPRQAGHFFSPQSGRCPSQGDDRLGCCTAWTAVVGYGLPAVPSLLTQPQNLCAHTYHSGRAYLKQVPK